MLAVMELGPALRRARLGAGLTQRQVAQAAGTAQTAIAAYENGKKSPNAATLARLAVAMGVRLRVDFVPPHGDEREERPSDQLSPQELRSLWLHRAISAAIQAEPERALMVARDNLAVRRRADEGEGAESWRRAWEALLDGPVDSLLAVLCSTSTYACQLRQTAPFAGLLAPRERWAVYASFARASRHPTAAAG